MRRTKPGNAGGAGKRRKKKARIGTRERQHEGHTENAEDAGTVELEDTPGAALRATRERAPPEHHGPTETLQEAPQVADFEWGDAPRPEAGCITAHVAGVSKEGEYGAGVVIEDAQGRREEDYAGRRPGGILAGTLRALSRMLRMALEGWLGETPEKYKRIKVYSDYPLETLMEKGGQLDSLCSEAAGVVRSLIKDCRIPVEFVRIEAEDRHPDEERGEHNRAAFHRARRLATKGAEDGEQGGTDRDHRKRRTEKKKGTKSGRYCINVHLAGYASKGGEGSGAGVHISDIHGLIWKGGVALGQGTKTEALLFAVFAALKMAGGNGEQLELTHEVIRIYTKSRWLLVLAHGEDLGEQVELGAAIGTLLIDFPLPVRILWDDSQETGATEQPGKERREVRRMAVGGGLDSLSKGHEGGTIGIISRLKGLDQEYLWTGEDIKPMMGTLEWSRQQKENGLWSPVIGPKGQRRSPSEGLGDGDAESELYYYRAGTVEEARTAKENAEGAFPREEEDDQKCQAGKGWPAHRCCHDCKQRVGIKIGGDEECLFCDVRPTDRCCHECKRWLCNMHSLKAPKTDREGRMIRPGEGGEMTVYCHGCVPTSEFQGFRVVDPGTKWWKPQNGCYQCGSNETYNHCDLCAVDERKMKGSEEGETGKPDGQEDSEGTEDKEPVEEGEERGNAGGTKEESGRTEAKKGDKGQEGEELDGECSGGGRRGNEPLHSWLFTSNFHKDWANTEQCQIKLLDGETRTAEYAEGATVEGLKRQLHEATKMPMNAFALRMGSHILEERRTLRSFGVRQRTTIYEVGTVLREEGRDHIAKRVLCGKGDLRVDTEVVKRKEEDRGTEEQWGGTQWNEWQDGVDKFRESRVPPLEVGETRLSPCGETWGARHRSREIDREVVCSVILWARAMESVLVHHLDGNTSVHKLDGSTTAEQIMLRIHRGEERPLGTMVIRHGQNLLRPSGTLASQGIQPHDVLHEAMTTHGRWDRAFSWGCWETGTEGLQGEEEETGKKTAPDKGEADTKEAGTVPEDAGRANFLLTYAAELTEELKEALGDGAGQERAERTGEEDIMLTYAKGMLFRAAAERWGIAADEEKEDVAEMMAYLMRPLHRVETPPPPPPPPLPRPPSPPPAPDEDADRNVKQEENEEGEEAVPPPLEPEAAPPPPERDTGMLPTGMRTRSRYEKQRRQFGLKTCRICGMEPYSWWMGRRHYCQHHFPSEEAAFRDGYSGSDEEEGGDGSESSEGLVTPPPSPQMEWAQAERGRQPLNLKLPNGKTLVVDYLPDTSTNQLRQKIRDSEGIPMDRMILRNGTRILRPDQSLRAQGVKAEDNITVVPNHIRGGGTTNMTISTEVQWKQSTWGTPDPQTRNGGEGGAERKEATEQQREELTGRTGEERRGQSTQPTGEADASPGTRETGTEGLEVRPQQYCRATGSDHRARNRRTDSRAEGTAEDGNDAPYEDNTNQRGAKRARRGGTDRGKEAGEGAGEGLNRDKWTARNKGSGQEEPMDANRESEGEQRNGTRSRGSSEDQDAHNNPPGGPGDGQEDSSGKGRWSKDQERRGKDKGERAHNSRPTTIAYVAGHSLEGQTCGAGIVVSGKEWRGMDRQLRPGERNRSTRGGVGPGRSDPQNQTEWEKRWGSQPQDGNHHGLRGRSRCPRQRKGQARVPEDSS